MFACISLRGRALPEAPGVHADVRPDIPDIVVNFHHDFHFEVTQLHISEISPDMHAAAVRLPLYHLCYDKSWTHTSKEANQNTRSGHHQAWVW